MTFQRIDFPHAWAELSTFAPEGGIIEHHALLHVEPGQGRFEQQLDLLHQAYQQLLATLPKAQVVMRRYLLSDIANQAPIMNGLEKFEGSKGTPHQPFQTLQPPQTCTIGATSLIGQPPLDGSKVALWVYLTEGLEVIATSDRTVTRHNGYRHIWTTNMQSTTGGSSTQTREILEDYEAQLRHEGLNLADHCLRTWFFIRDVDTNYKGMVEARCNNFTMQRLTPDTHYIASTGIGGQPIIREARVQMDCYTAEGLEPAQQQYLYAPTHLNPTYQYGVTFERGTAIQYGDRRHLLISGTASINNRGEVVHVGDVEAQTYRMLENIETLLREGGATLQDIAQAIIYLRDVADYPLVRRIFDERLPQMPRVITLAPVCRPAWLIEMECIAITPQSNSTFRPF